MRTTRTTAKCFATAIALVMVAAIWLAWGGRWAQAIQDSEDFPSPIGVTRGQTVRLTVVNIGDRAIVGPEYRLLDSAGRTLAQTPEPHLFPPGQFQSFDFDLPDLPPGIADNFGRIQARVTAIGARKPGISSSRLKSSTTPPARPPSPRSFARTISNRATMNSDRVSFLAGM